MLHIAIQDARRKSGLTQIELAEKIGVSRAAVSHWEKGRYSPSPDRLLRLEQTLNCDLTDVSAGAMGDDDATPRTRSSKGRRPAPPNSLPDVTLVEVMSSNWRRDEVAVFHATDADRADVDLLIGDLAFHMNDPAMISGLLFRGGRLEPHFRDGKLIKLGPGRQARPEHFVLVVGGVETGGRTARFGRLLQASADRVLLRRHNPERDEEIPFSDTAAMFRVLD